MAVVAEPCLSAGRISATLRPERREPHLIIPDGAKFTANRDTELSPVPVDDYSPGLIIGEQDDKGDILVGTDLKNVEVTKGNSAGLNGGIQSQNEETPISLINFFDCFKSMRR